MPFVVEGHQIAQVFSERPVTMIDAHCHIDLYPDPTATLESALRAGVSTLMVTNLPSAYQRAHPFVRNIARARLALGLHPLEANRHMAEMEAFKSLEPTAFYIGEIGLDFSYEGLGTKEQQIKSFQFVLDTIAGRPKLMTLHSRRAEKMVLDMLRSANRTPVVLHWYSGSLKTLRDAVVDGHYFSVNPAMIESDNGRRIISGIPRQRMLTETDGPFVHIDGRSAIPQDVRLVEEYLCRLWGCSSAEVSRIISSNFAEIMKRLKLE